MELLAILVTGIILLCVVLINGNKQNKLMKDLLLKNESKPDKDLSLLKMEISNELASFRTQVNQDIKDDLNRLNVNTTTSLDSVKDSVNKELNFGLEKSNQSLLEISKQLVSIDETQKTLDGLSGNIIQLQNVLTDKSSRGAFGEIELYSILKSAYGLDEKQYQKQYKLDNGKIPDAVIFSPSPLNLIAIDSKFPLENYVRMYNTELTNVEQQRASTQFGNDVKKHIKDISSKYIIKNQTADFALMFVPAEAVFSEIYSKFEDVIFESHKAKVFIVSPTTLMAYITAMKAIHLSQEQNSRVDEIQIEYGKLAVEFERFEKRFNSVVNKFDTAKTDLQNVELTAEKIIKRFKEIEAVDLGD